MKKVFTLLFLLVAFNNLQAQTPNWLWVKQSNGGNFEDGGGIVSDGVGNFYYSDRLGGTITFGAKTATASGATTAYNAKFNTAGNFSWISPHNYSGGENYVRGVALDKWGHSISIGTAESINTLFIDRRDSVGNYLWGFTAPITNTGAADPTGMGVAVDDSGNVYATGQFVGSITFGSTTLTSAGDKDIFLAKLDSNGHPKWAVRAGDAGFDVATSVVLDKANNIYICGMYTGTPVFGTITAPAATGGNTNFFITKFDNTGNALWVNIAANAGTLNGAWWAIAGVAIDPCGNLYVTSSYENTAQFGSQLSVTSAGSDDIFVAKCTSDGQWAWVSSAGGSNSDRGYAIALDKDLDVYIAGAYTISAQFGSQIINSAGGVDAFVAKYTNSTGDLQWVQTGGGSDVDVAMGIAVDSQKFVYITGTFNAPATFGNYLTGTPNGFNILFIAKLDTVPNRSIVSFPDSVYCPNSSANLAFSVTGSFNSGNVFTAELSDSTGSFSSPIIIGTLTDTTGGNIPIQFSSNLANGKYIIRVISSSPAYSSHSTCSGSSNSPIPTNNSLIKIGGGFSVNINPADTSVCSGSSVQLNASGGSTYSWSPGSTLSDSTIANPLATPSASQTYTVTAGSGSCGRSSKVIVVNVAAGSNISVSPADTSVCPGMTVTLHASGAASYRWSPGGTLNDSTIANPVSTSNNSITYNVTSASGVCSNTFVVTVNVGNNAVGGAVNAVRDTICQGTPGNLTLSGNSNSNVQWQSSTDDINFTDLTGDTLVKYKTAPLTQTTWYRAIVGSGICTAVSDTQQLFVPPVLVAYFNAKTTGANQLSFNSDSSLGKIRSYHWDFGDNSTSTDSNPSHTYIKDTIYYVCLTLYDGSNCSYTFCRYSEVVDAIPTVSAAGDWIIYPNPFGNQLTISSKRVANRIEAVEMYDVLGRLVINKNSGNDDIGKISTDLQLDALQLAKGMYYVIIRTANADYVQKVVKQ